MCIRDRFNRNTQHHPPNGRPGNRGQQNHHSGNQNNNRNSPNNNNRPDDNYRGNGHEQRTNGHPNDHNYYGNRYHPNYQYNRGPGGNQYRNDDRRRVNFIRGQRQNNQRRYRPNCYYQVSNNNNNPPAEGRNDEPPRNEDNQSPREENAQNIRQVNSMVGVRSGTNNQRRDGPSGSNQAEEDYDWIPFSDDPAENFRIAYNKRNPPELWIPPRNKGNRSNTPQTERQIIDEGPRIAQVNNIRAVSYTHLDVYKRQTYDR